MSSHNNKAALGRRSQSRQIVRQQLIAHQTFRHAFPIIAFAHAATIPLSKELYYVFIVTYAVIYLTIRLDKLKSDRKIWAAIAVPYAIMLALRALDSDLSKIVDLSPDDLRILFAPLYILITILGANALCLQYRINYNHVHAAIFTGSIVGKTLHIVINLADISIVHLLSFERDAGFALQT